MKIPSEINPPLKFKPIRTPTTSAESVSSDLDEEVNFHTYLIPDPNPLLTLTYKIYVIHKKSR